VGKGTLHEFLNPLSLENIRELVQKGDLKDYFLNCGRAGFNILPIGYNDYETILKIVREQLKSILGYANFT